MTQETAEPLPLPDLQKLRTILADRHGQYIDDLRTLVDTDCGTFVPEGVNEVADFMQQRLESDGWSVQRRRHSPGEGETKLGDVVVATVRGDRVRDDGDASGGIRGRRILLIGHMDTVFPIGTPQRRPFRVEGSRAFGPGVTDMKAGLLAGYYAVSALRESGDTPFDSITFVCNPDEEIGSPFSRATIEECARAADVCFVLEAARQNGAVVSARKGVADRRIVYHGRSAHAGVEPERGRSATLQAAHATVALHELNGRWPGVTVNVGVIRGGIRPNVVADECELEVDIRSPTAPAFDDVVAEVDRIARTLVVPDVRVEVQERAGFPPMEKTEATARLVEQAREIARRIGFDVEDAATGGASDANPVAGLGVPVLDGLGPVGGAPHSDDEWLDLESVVPRTTLLAGLIATVS